MRLVKFNFWRSIADQTIALVRAPQEETRAGSALRAVMELAQGGDRRGLDVRTRCRTTCQFDRRFA